jgi:hypothetical protein
MPALSVSFHIIESGTSTLPTKKHKTHFFRNHGSIITHIRRIFEWKLKPLPAKVKKLQDVGITNDALQAYFAWRHLMLLESLPALFFCAIFDIISFIITLSDDYGGLNCFTKFIISISFLGSMVLFITAVWALCGWSQWCKSTPILKIGWAIAFVLPLVPVLFPLEFLLDGEVKDGLDNEFGKAYLFNLKIILAISYALQLFPVLVTLPSGLARGSLRVRGLMPQALLSSWILLISAPFQSVVMLMALVLLIQVAGNWILMIGKLCLV